MTRDDADRFERFKRFEEWEARQPAEPSQERAVGVLWQEWYEALRGPTKKNRRVQGRHIERPFSVRGVVVTLAELKPSECTPIVLQAWLAMLSATPSSQAGDEMADKGNGPGNLSPSTVDQIRMGIQSMFKYHIGLGELKVNPFWKVPRDKRRDRQREGYYTSEELERFAAAMPQIGAWILRHAFRTCCRKDNIRLLRKHQIDFAGKDLVLTVKGGDQARVAVPDDTLEEMRALVAVAPGEFVYPNPLHPFDPVPEATLQGWVKRARKTTGLILPGGEAPNLHHARHGGAVALLDAGADISQVQAQLVHKNITQTARYLKMRDRRRDKLRGFLNKVR